MKGTVPDILSDVLHVFLILRKRDSQEKIVQEIGQKGNQAIFLKKAREHIHTHFFPNIQENAECISLSLSFHFTHVHTHTHIYIYMHIHVPTVRTHAHTTHIRICTLHARTHKSAALIWVNRSSSLPVASLSAVAQWRQNETNMFSSPHPSILPDPNPDNTQVHAAVPVFSRTDKGLGLPDIQF